jgi:hypothetical protein
MHVRIRQRRESVDAKAVAGVATADFSSVLQMMDAIETRALAIEASCHDERLPALMSAMKSARLIMEMSVRNPETAKQLMPCANAALLHIRSEMLLIARDLRDGAIPECELAKPHASDNGPQRSLSDRHH